MRSVEVTANTLEEARSQAAEQLGVTEEELQVEQIGDDTGRPDEEDVTIRATLADAGAEADDAAAAPEGPGTPPCVAASTPTAERAVAAVNEILRLMGTNNSAVLQAESPRDVSIEIVGPGAGALIGRHGVTLHALQLITSIIASRNVLDGARVTLDAEGYRARRQEMLERMAHAHAAKVRAAHKEIVITDLKPYERRVIHLALQDDPDVETYSEGEGDERYIVISPRAAPQD